MSVEIREVTNKKERSLFVDYPNKLHGDNPNFVPAFYGDDMDDWDPEKNPAFSYCDAKAFLAYRDGEIVGRIGAIISYKANEKWGTSRMRFSQLDFIDDIEVSTALFETVENWAREKGCDEVHGPLGFCDMDREGLLVEGFDRRSMFITYYNEPYYLEHLAKLGYVKDTDWVEHLITLGNFESENYKKLKRISDVMLRRTGFHKADVKHRRDYKPYIKKAFELVNVAYSPLYGTVELNEQQVKKYADKFIPLINPDYVCFLLNDDEDLIGFGVAAPSMAEAMKKCKGKLFPFGWIGVLKALQKNDTCDLLLIAVRPEYQKTGVNGIILEHLYRGAIKNGIKWAETGPQLEDNRNVQGQWKTFEIEQHKRRRCFVKKLD